MRTFPASPAAPQPCSPTRGAPRPARRAARQRHPSGAASSSGTGRAAAARRAQCRNGEKLSGFLFSFLFSFFFFFLLFLFFPPFNFYFCLFASESKSRPGPPQGDPRLPPADVSSKANPRDVLCRHLIGAIGRSGAGRAGLRAAVHPCPPRPLLVQAVGRHDPDPAPLRCGGNRGSGGNRIPPGSLSEALARRLPSARALGRHARSVPRFPPLSLFFPRSQIRIA